MFTSMPILESLQESTSLLQSSVLVHDDHSSYPNRLYVTHFQTDRNVIYVGACFPLSIVPCHSITISSLWASSLAISLLSSSSFSPSSDMAVC